MSSVIVNGVILAMVFVLFIPVSVFAPSHPEYVGFDSPRKQVAQGVLPSAVTCNEGLSLIVKNSGTPACVKESTLDKLEKRGWGGVPGPCCKKMHEETQTLPDYQKNENNNSAVFSVGKLKVDVMDVKYYQNSIGYLAAPQLEGDYPGIIMIHEWWGLNDNIKEMAEKLASHGYVVLAVDLYDGNVAVTSEQARSLIGSFEKQYWIDNMNAATSYLQVEYLPEKIGSIGWCFGGGQSLNLALNNEMDATVIYYGNLETQLDVLSVIDWPVLGIFAGLDTGIPPETVNEFESALDELSIPNEIYIYPDVNHAFANPSGDRYAPEESSDAWNKTIEFLENNLKN